MASLEQPAVDLTARARALLVLLVCWAGGAEPQYFLHSVNPIDTWDSGGTLITIGGSFPAAAAGVRAYLGQIELQVVQQQSSEQYLVVVSPRVEGSLPTADYDVTVSVDGKRLPWSATAQPIHKLVRVHNYRLTVEKQMQMTEAVQLQLLNPSTISTFAEHVLLKQFYSAERSDHTLCGIGGDRLSVCPSFDVATYALERVEGVCLRERREGTVPLRFYWSAAAQDNAATAAKKLLPSAKGFDLVRNVCYIWKDKGAASDNRVGLELFYNEARKDHLAVATQEGRAWAKANGYTTLGLQGYVQRLLQPRSDTDDASNNTAEAEIAAATQRALRKVDRMLARMTDNS